MACSPSASIKVEVLMCIYLFRPILLIGLLLLYPAPALAAPMFTSFRDAVSKSEWIVVAKLAEKVNHESHKVKLDVVRALKGKLEPGVHEVKFEDVPGGGPGELIAFLDKDRVWRFVAVPLYAKKVDQDILEIQGFYDSNAHFVYPGLLTVEQLQTYLKNGSLVYRFGGPICFPQAGKLPWKPGTLQITGSYDAIKEKAMVTGLPDLKDFPAQPEVFIQDTWNDAHIGLAYRHDNNRPLRLMGKLEAVDPKSGEMRVRFAVSAPEILTEKSLRDYLADGRRGPCCYTFRLTGAPTKEEPKGRELTLTLGGELGATGRIAGWGEKPIPITGTSFRSPTERSGSASDELPKKVAKDLIAKDWVLQMIAPTDSGEYLVLSFDLGKPKPNPDGFSWPFQNKLLYALHTSPVCGTLQLHDGEKLSTVTTVTVSLDSFAFTSNPPE
jgi:hypothetical protein